MKLLERRALPEGGFAPRIGEPFRSDATAWGILALSRLAPSHPLLQAARARLATAQEPDGRVSMGRAHAEAFWPTALSVLAWNGSQVHENHRSRCILFLLKTTGFHRLKTRDDQAGHDPSIPGWPWIGGTHSWIEPTALAVMALKVTGNGQHDRVQQAVRMILNRQLPHGGWNYGNTLAFGRELHPMPESTGAALTGLAGIIDREKVSRSIDYLQREVNQLCTPVSLGWALLGLAAWDRWPSDGADLVERCLANQDRYGEYDTSALCLLLFAALTPEFIDTDRNQASVVLPQ